MASTSDFWRLGTNEGDIVGGPARILVSQRSVTTYPLLISDVLNLNTYQPQTNWFDLGHTMAPFVSTSGFDTQNWVSQQQGVINVQVGSWNRAITVTFMESKNNKVMDFVHEADGRTLNSDGDQVEYFWDKPATTEWRLVAINLKEEGTAGSNIIMDVFPFVKRSGADSETSWDRGNPQGHSVEMKPFPDTGVPFDASWYRVTQL